MSSLEPRDYVSVHGARKGDRIRLGDTSLVIEVEDDAQEPGSEFLAGFGKTARDGLHLKAASVAATCDLVISNVVVIEPPPGTRKVWTATPTARTQATGPPGTRTRSTAWISSSAPGPRSCPA